MDIQRKNVGRKKAIRWTITGVVLVGVLVGGSLMVKQLKPAAPSVEMSTLWPDQVKRGPMVLEVRGLGTLVPEDTLLLTATTDGPRRADSDQARHQRQGRFGRHDFEQPGTGNAAGDRRIPDEGR